MPRRLTVAIILLISSLALTLTGVARESVVSAFRACNAEAPAACPLEEYLALAHQKQPALAALRARLAAAQDGQRGLDALGFPLCLARELPYRKQQAALGVSAAAADLEQGERETVYAVTRTYYTVVYARAQEKVAHGVVERLKATNGIAARMLKEGARDATESDVDRSSTYMDLADVKRIQASVGIDRALAALREAIGLGPCADVQVLEDTLPQPEARPCRDEVIAGALAHRGEIIMTESFAAVAALEVDAQRTSQHQRMETFATGADIHVRTPPQGVHNHDYRPGGIAPEMPITLVGPTCERVAHATSLSAEAAAVAEKARILVVLEVEDAFRRWEEATLKVEKARSAATSGKKMADNLGKDLAAGLKVKIDDVLNAHVVASQAQSQVNEFTYDQILALADLERATGGAFCAGLHSAAVPSAPMPRKAAGAGPADGK
jgi:outer membrane protein TolC